MSDLRYRTDAQKIYGEWIPIMSRDNLLHVVALLFLPLPPVSANKVRGPCGGINIWGLGGRS